MSPGNNTKLVKEDVTKKELELKEQPGKNIAAGSLSIASALLKQNLIDEFWFLIHPIILGTGKQII